jgi:tRNA A-37 threonylcarbamoyl transferase component Bud32/Tfp pilus assembly protein PilF
VSQELERLRAVLAGRYAIQRLIGSGGMAAVYLAYDLRHERRVAVKTLRPDLAAALGVERFLREIHIAAQLSHPNILPLLDSGEADGLPYYVMPYVEGESLRERLRREVQLAIPDVVTIARDVADALDAAHAQGIVHRDIKPENILLSGNRALVADFGIARAVDMAGGETLTATGVVIGTPAYMSPEQGRGSGVVDKRTDIYALGCVVYELLAGEPPFPGQIAQSVIAQHVLEQVPSLTIVRPSVPEAARRAVERALAKAPADRFATASEFARALADAAVTREVPPRPRPRPVLPLLAVAILGILGIWAAVRALRDDGSTAPLDPHTVVVFPFPATDDAANAAGTGWEVALAIGGALEHGHPLKFLDGWTWLAESMRADPRLITPAVENAIARARGARYYASGVIRPDGDGWAVAVRLQDVAGDSLVAQETAAGGPPATAQTLGIRAVARLVPRIVEPGRAPDLEPYLERDAGAVLLSVQGDRQYRHSRFGAALDFYRRAVAEDSLLAFAAVKGAQAASWENRYSEAEELIAVATARAALLPPKYRLFADGWRSYLGGDGDSAVAALRAALDLDPEWTEARMALGEVYYHLFPNQGLDRAQAEPAFRRVLARDSLFAPALFHLGEIAARAGDFATADRAIRDMRAAGADTTWVRQVTVMRDCAAAGVAGYDWKPAVDADPFNALLAARALAVAGRYPSCAERGFAQVLGAARADRDTHWGAVMGLQSLLLAEGRYQEALAHLDLARDAGFRGVYSLYVFDALAGAPFEARAAEAEAIARRAAGNHYERAQAGTRWLLGTWSARKGSPERAAGIVAGLRREADENDAPALRQIAGLLEAHAAAVRGDTAAARLRLTAFRPHAPPAALTWGVTDAHAAERALLADLLLAAGDYEGAEAAAGVFDHQEPVSFWGYLPRSLLVRWRAATALGRASAARAYRDRLVALGWADSVSAAQAP